MQHNPQGVYLLRDLELNPRISEEKSVLCEESMIGNGDPGLPTFDG